MSYGLCDIANGIFVLWHIIFIIAFTMAIHNGYYHNIILLLHDVDFVSIIVVLHYTIIITNAKVKGHLLTKIHKNLILLYITECKGRRMKFY